MTTETEFNAVWDVENDNDEPWYNPPSSDVRHAMPGEDNLVPCCGRRYDAIGTDWTTSDPERVNCGGVTDES